MKHLQIDTIIDYLHHELAPGDDAEVLAHLEACADCTAELNVEASITDRMRAAARAEELEVPSGLRSAILTRIAGQRRGLLESLRGWVQPLVFVPVAAAVAAAAIFFFPAHTPPSSQSGLPVSFYLQQYAVHAQQNPLADRGTAIMASFDDTAR